MIFAARFKGHLDDLHTQDQPFWHVGSDGLLGRRSSTVAQLMNNKIKPNL
jgi:hypothetical protein